MKLTLRTIDGITASLDRIDSSGDYSEGNVQWVHKNINMMKRTMSNSEFIEYCLMVTSTQYNN